MAASQHGRVVAVLGPTNTGKTHFAVERMLGYETGAIGLPLRLLAREIYDKVVRQKGAAAVALVTGEEKIAPPRARYFVGTTEAMPVGREVDFLAVDEVQLAADDERGHVFTDRILNARGRHETLFLGADTIRPILRRLVPEAQFVSRPRFSKLGHAGPRKLTRLPPRSAVVAFSAAEVYRLAEVLRSQRGGAAVVLGALSPRARNAQVALFQAGEVDYLVATDAIGMGLNMDVTHVAFAGLRKFDGVAPRELSAAELAQIAGRAGRHHNDGTFGTTAEVGPLPPETVAAIEGHAFPPLRSVMWRNERVGFGSLAALLRDLEAPPPFPGMIRQGRAVDHQALAALAADPEIAGLAAHPEAIRLLWEVCQVPDFRKVLADAHVRFLGQVYRHLRGPAGRLPEDWVAASIARLDRPEGDIDTLMGRISHIRTWTYVANRPDWLADPRHWQERTRAIEDRLSDALHDGLTQRFVDRRTSRLVRSLRDGGEAARIDGTGEVVVGDDALGRLDGLRFVPYASASRREGRAVWSVAARALRAEVAARIAAIAAAEDSAFTPGRDLRVAWMGGAIGHLRAGPRPLSPRVEPIVGDLVDADGAARVRQRLEAWLEAWLKAVAKPFRRVGRAHLGGAARGIVYQLAERFGVVPVGAVREQIAALDDVDRRSLARLGVRIGRHHVYLDAAFGGGSLLARALLWAAWEGRSEAPPPPPVGIRAIPVDPAVPEGFYHALGFVPIGGRAIRVDALERIAASLRRALRAAGSPAFAEQVEERAAVGGDEADWIALLSWLGYRRTVGDDGVALLSPVRRARRGKSARVAGDSPFAALASLTVPR
jgi:ATP-dependent RNA helicase SUPV3L1/SUV3